VKIKSGGGVKASPRESEEDPRELKTHEGIEHQWSINPCAGDNGLLLGARP
jgi:hypothetical protein